MNTYKVAFPPYSLPYDIMDQLNMISFDPTPWFVGQIVKYLLRPNKSFQKVVDAILAKAPKVSNFSISVGVNLFFYC